MSKLTACRVCHEGCSQGVWKCKSCYKREHAQMLALLKDIVDWPDVDCLPESGTLFGKAVALIAQIEGGKSE